MANEPDVLEQLYAAEPGQFVAERTRLERELRDAGRAAEADDLAARPKPAVPVFAANRLARDEEDDVAGLIAAGERLSAAHEAGDPGALRTEQADLARRVAGLVQKAQVSDAMEQRLAVLLRTAAGDPDSADLLRRGVLSEELEPAAFGALAGLSLAPQKKRPAAPKADRATEKKRDARVEELRSELEGARDELRRAKREREKAEADVERAERRVAQLERRLRARAS